MKIRVLSDLHIDVNKDYPFTLDSLDDCFTIIAGDISGSPDKTIEWINNNIKSGVFVCGNHLVYSKEMLTVRQRKSKLHKAFPITSDITFLDDSVGVISKEVNGILFVGTCFYTDYMYEVNDMVSKDNQKRAQQINMNLGWRGLNDFRWGYTKLKKFELSPKEQSDWIKWHDPFGTRELKVPKYDYEKTLVTPEDYLKWHKKSFTHIKKIIEENENGKNLPVVLITHHPLSSKALDPIYVDSEINSSYISDYEKFIIDHTSIKCVVSGHVHSQTTFDIERPDGSVCKYIVNPRGYMHHAEDKNFTPNCFIDTETWAVSKNKTKDEDEEYKARNKEYGDNLLKLAALGFF